MELEAEATRAPSVVVGVVAVTSSSGSGLDSRGVWVVLMMDALLLAEMTHMLLCMSWMCLCRTISGRAWRVVGAVAVARQASRQKETTARDIFIVSLRVCV